jgi:hypothetical protein
MHWKCKLIHNPNEPCPADATPEDYARADRVSHEEFERALGAERAPEQHELPAELPLACVALVEQINGRWFGVLETHQPCRPRAQHKQCTIVDRRIMKRGFDTPQEAERAYAAWLGHLADRIILVDEGDKS